MKLTQLKYFQAICKYGNLTRASRELHISQSSLSGIIKELEEEFGVLLFYRLSRGLVLTKEGEFFLQEITGLLDHADQVTEHMRELKDTDQVVTLGVPPMLSVLFFPRLLALFQKEFPGARLELAEGGSLANEAEVADGSLDAAMISCEAGTPLALLGEDSFLTSCVDRNYQALGKKPNVVLNTNQLAAVSQIIRGGTAASFLFENVLPPEPDVAVLSVEDLPPVQVCLIWNEGRKLSPCAVQFIQMVKSAGSALTSGLSTGLL